ncbi:carbonic anhydrase [uncultured Tateyamaria sp.]|uniref:carbonic anhydrase n=1 Tax=uncultured Tateyamaria sp. TaxID=455651 RepID=UPI00261A7D58|nr:carbonic anhydrase [uncultured Tateyamaria sp.]
MHRMKPLPSFLLQRYQGWKATTYAENSAWYQRLATEGQRPRAMIISCCDSRVNVTSIFGADQGEFFVHRNIANLVPPYEPDGEHHGTSAAVEYAVTVLKVAHLVVLGHSRCGGVQGCIDMCEGRAPELEEKGSFVGRWMDILRPKFPEVADMSVPETKAERLEQLAVVTSMENLMSFPFVEERVNAGSLSIHGLRMDIENGGLSQFMGKTLDFQPV